MWAVCWWESQKERNQQEDPDIGEDNIKLDLKEIGRAWTGLIQFKIGTNGRLL